MGLDEYRGRDGQSRYHCLFTGCELTFLPFRYIDPETGRRSDTAHGYIYNQIDTNHNLKVFCGKRVVRVLFE